MNSQIPIPQAKEAKLNNTAIKAFFNVVEKWQLTNEEARTLLGKPPESTFYQWKKGEAKKLSHDTLVRISYVLGIFKALELIYTETKNADAWIRKPNAYFAGHSALDRLMGGEITDLAYVRSYLDTVRGGW